MSARGVSYFAQLEWLEQQVADARKNRASSTGAGVAYWDSRILVLLSLADSVKAARAHVVCVESAQLRNQAFVP